MPPLQHARFSRWHSIHRRLPLLTLAVVVSVVVILGLLSYQAVERTLLVAANDRLASSANELADLLAQAARARQGQLDAFADNEAIRRFLETGEAEDRDAAAEALSSLLDEQTLAVGLWTPQGERILAVSANDSDEIADSDAAAGVAPGLGPIDAHGEISYYRVAAPVSAAGAPSSRSPILAMYRRLGARRTAELLAGLVGPEARLLLGSTANGVWTDLIRPVGAPIPGSIETGASIRSDDDGTDRIGTALAVAETPWLLWVDRPTEVVLEPANDFLRQMSSVSLLFVLAAAAVTYAFGRRITRPLDALTSAAAGLAEGDLSRAVPVHRRDEVGRVARAFDRMRQQVSEAKLFLEDRVAERTADLRQAVVSLEETQEELVRSERLAILGQLASGVGHELRNPLAVMTNAIYYLEMILEDPDAEVTEYLGILRHQVSLSDRIVGDLLDFARVKTPAKERLSLSSLVADQLGRLDSEATSNVAVSISPDLPDAHGDPVQIGQVVLNLLTNALQATEDVEVTPSVTVSARVGEDSTVLFVVEDAGPGVPEELRTRIFEPLVTTKARGIGLGLAVSRRLAEANGGDLALGHTPQAGASFVLTLPRWQEDPP